MSRSVRFNINSPNFSGIGKFGIQGTNDEGVAADFYFSATLGGNTVIAETLFGSNVADGAAYSNYSFALAVDASTGLLMTGVYTVNIIAKQVGGATVLNTYTETFGFNPYGSTRVQGLTITDSIDCINGQFTLTDATAYRTASDTTVTRSWTVTGPAVMGVGQPGVTGSDSYVTVAFAYVNVTYQAYLVSDISYVNASGGDITLTEVHQYTLDQNYFVDCDNNLCEIKQCLYDTLASLNAAACRLGGFDKLDGNDRAKWFKLQQYLAGWQVANECQDATSRQAYYLLLKELLDCGCAEDTAVKPFSLPDGSSPVHTVWALVGTAFQNSFVNGVPALRWRVDRDDNLQIVGKIQAPGGLVVATPYIITTGFITADISTILAMIYPADKADGSAPLGTLRVNTSGDLIFTPGVGYSGGAEFFYVDIITPLNT